MSGEETGEETELGARLRYDSVSSEDGGISDNEGQRSRGRGNGKTKRDFSSRQTAVYDDGTNTFFWQAHSLTVLAIMIICFLWVSLVEDRKDDTALNTKRGLGACVLAFCAFGMTQAKDGPMVRPHPAFWRLFLCLSIVYELCLVFILFQAADDSRKLMSYIDPELGKPLPEQSYAEDCRLYDPGHSGGPFHNFWDKWDIFVFAHLAGWYFKMLMIRDYWVCWVISVMFEVLEYSLEHQLPNFAECWWDHWLMDVMICNGIGIWLGMVTINYLELKTYSWRGLWHIPTYGGKLKRMVLQFTPYSWTKFEWRPTENLRRWLAVLGIMSLFLLAELDTFYLKAILWIPPPHYLNWVRLAIYVPCGSVALRETYQFMDDSNCKKFGQQSWIMAAIIVSEFLIVLKYDFHLVLRPFPTHVTAGWLIFLTVLAIYTIWRFLFHSFVFSHRKTTISHNNPTQAGIVIVNSPHQMKFELGDLTPESLHKNGTGQARTPSNGAIDDITDQTRYQTRYSLRSTQSKKIR